MEGLIKILLYTCIMGNALMLMGVKEAKEQIVNDSGGKFVGFIGCYVILCSIFAAVLALCLL